MEQIVNLEQQDDNEQGRSKPRTSRRGLFNFSQKPPVPESRTLTHEYHASWISKLTFTWIGPMMNAGYHRTLQLNDIWTVSPDRSMETLLPKFETALSSRRGRGEKHPLCGALIEACWFDFWSSGLTLLFASILMICAPFVLRYLIQYVAEAYVARSKGEKEPSMGRGFGLLVGIVMMQELQSLCANYASYRGMLLGGQARAILVASIFKKSLTISSRAKAGDSTTPPIDTSNSGAIASSDDIKEEDKTKKYGMEGTGATASENLSWSNGRVMALTSIDAHRVDEALANWHSIWTGFIEILLALALLIINLGYSPLTGYGLIFVSIPILGKAIGKLFETREEINTLTDQRGSLTYEIFQGIRFVKLFGWEKAFLDRVQAVRKREAQKIGRFLALRNAVAVLSINLPTFASILTLVTYALTKHSMGSATVFSSVGIFNVLKLPLTTIPAALSAAADGWSALQRIQSYLVAEDGSNLPEGVSDGSELEEIVTADEHGDSTSGSNDSDNQDVKNTKSSGTGAVKLQNTSFTWEKNCDETTNSDNASKESADPRTNKGLIDSQLTLTGRKFHGPFTLHPMSFTLQRGQLVAVIGGVGSGKSSLLAALTGEMRKTGGTLTWATSRAYCPQEPWIQNTTVRNNILFGKEMQEGWYRKVIQACALSRDFEIIPNGDMTEIGERGITMSGGQKQRINLARAIYADTDALLLDSPLSAVDAHVGKHIFEQAIVGLLKKKLCILVTHQIDILPRCDKIIWVENGSIRAMDTFSSLMAENQDFAKMMAAGTAGNQNEEAVDHDQSTKTSPAQIGEESQNFDAAGESLIKAEHQATKSVSWKVYMDYLRCSGSIYYIVITLIVITISQGPNIGTNLWLSWWIQNKFHLVLGLNVGIYVALGFANVIMSYAYFLSLSLIALTSSRVMYDRALNRVLHTTAAYFDTTPLGRIVGVFSKDVDQMDYNLTDSLRIFIMLSFMYLSTCVLTIAYFYWFALALVPLMLIFLGMSQYYRKSAREIKRHEATLQSIVYSRMSEALSGISCIRTYRVEAQFIDRMKQTIDDMNSAYYLTFANQRWFSLRLDLIGNLLLFVSGTLAVTSRFSTNPSTTGLVLSYMLGVSQILQFIVKQFAVVENAMNSTERLHYYGTALEQEEDTQASRPPPPPSWPESGEIKFIDVAMRYRPELPLVLEGFNLHIRGGERIGFVGRTGAGKSSLLSTLFRLSPLARGKIIIDNQDISRLALQQLRSRLAVIPQDPTLFRGTIRSNLDPFSEYTDLQLWSVLRKASLYSDSRLATRKSDSTLMVPSDLEEFSSSLESAFSISESKVGPQAYLDDVVEEEGRNFSLGQRQLLALARALVRDAQIIICDEVTSAVDLETDLAIQRTMQEGFQGKTVLCVAHRLRTVLGYDRICVMDEGKILELDTPRKLFEKSDGVFREMCVQSGITRKDFEAI